MTQPNPQVSADDRDLLSAFLDQQLSAAERAALQERLAAEPALQRELDELRTTAALLRDLPPVRPPRSFTLDPAMVPARRQWFSFGLMRAGAAVAAVMLVLTFVPDLGRGRGLPAAAVSIPQMSESMSAATANPADSMTTANESAPKAALSTALPESAQNAAPTAAADALRVPVQPERNADGSVPYTLPPEDTAGGTAADAPEGARVDPYDSPGTLAAPAEGDAPSIQSSDSTSPDTTVLQAEPDPQPAGVQDALDARRWLQIGLAVLVLALTLAAFRLRPAR